MSPSPLPASVRLAWWGTAWLRGACPPDDLRDAVVDTDAVHLVDASPLLPGLADLRGLGATAFGAALPVEGDPAGLGGPAAFNRAAFEAGEAVIAVGAGRGLVPERVGAAVTWRVHEAERRPLPDVGEADRTLRMVLLETAETLADLDVAAWRPEAADALMNLRHRPQLVAPPGVPARCVELAGRALQALDIVDLALVDDGGALSVADAVRRRESLLPLGRAARQALVAAASPEVWPTTP